MQKSKETIHGAKSLNRKVGLESDVIVEWNKFRREHKEFMLKGTIVFGKRQSNSRNVAKGP